MLYSVSLAVRLYHLDSITKEDANGNKAFFLLRMRNEYVIVA